MKHELTSQVWEAFAAFSPGSKEGVEVYFAPGRVNLIGEHTDYNGGYVLPAALELGVYAIVRPRTDGIVRFASDGFEQEVTADIATLIFREEDDFANYPKGVIKTLQDQGIRFAGADFYYISNLPAGAGLSSSAAIELATATAVNHLADGGGASPKRLAEMSQTAENQFVGVNCGIMDQFAVAMGQVNHAISLDCKTLEYHLVPIQAAGYQLVIANTNKRRGLTDSKYNERRSECEAALAQLQQVRPKLTCLADIHASEWPVLEESITGDVLRRRARHVVQENTRAKTAAKVLADGDILRFGEMMIESHVSLRDDYEVTGVELDALAEAAWNVEGCIGSRMTGAGFGGCTVSLVANDAVARFETEVGARYTAATGLTPAFYVTQIGDGARRITEEVRGI